MCRAIRGEWEPAQGAFTQAALRPGTGPGAASQVFRRVQASQCDSRLLHASGVAALPTPDGATWEGTCPTPTLGQVSFSDTIASGPAV